MTRLNKDWSKEAHIIFVCIGIVDQILGGARVMLSHVSAGKSNTVGQYFKRH